MNNSTSLLNFILAIISAPFLLGVINRTKAVFAGRKGQPLFQLYFDLYKLCHKSTVYSKTISWVFKAFPVLFLSSMLFCLAMLPQAHSESLINFEGDLILFLCIFGLARFFTILAALDTGSSFEGMGASREVYFSLFAESALFVSFAALVRQVNSISLSGIYNSINLETWEKIGPILVIIAVVIFIIALVENSRIPFDDPNTHLELTMIHEVMVLDHGGVDFAFILYSGALKIWIFISLLAGILIPLDTGFAGLNVILYFFTMIFLSIMIGIIESFMARLLLIKVTRVVIGVLALSVLTLIFQLR